MATFGTFTLLVAFIVATYGGVASWVGARRGNQKLIASGRAAVYALAAVLSMSSVTIIYAFVTGDYSIKYIQRYSDASQPLFYKVTAYWGGLDGSILWWAFLLSVFSAIAVYTNRHRHREIMPYVVTTLMVICDFFLFLIVFHKNPFDTFLTEVPAQGQGLNPLLQNAYMITHPPSLYTGFVGMSIPYAFAMGALISGHLDDAWIIAVRRWTLMAWFFLSMGLTLGMLWAYEELGWGGFWAWDPVENAGFLPWLTATAFFHSVMIQERRGMLKIWNFTLVILTFLLTIIGTFLTRSGVVQSVHAFGEDKTLGKIFMIFMAAIIVISFGFLIKRLPTLRSRASLESMLSREAAFVANNWILLFSAFFVLFATMFPTISEGITGERISVGPPFFNKWMVPIGLGLLFLTGIGPLIAWRKATAGNLRYQFNWPILSGIVATIASIAAGLGRGIDGSITVSPVICFGLCAFTFTTMAQELLRGAIVRRKNTGADLLTAMVGMIIRGRRRYGGYFVHMGIVLMFLGFAGQAYQRDEEAHMVPGQKQNFGRYVVQMDRLIHEEDSQKEMVSAEFTIFAEGKEIGKMRPSRWFFHKGTEPTTEVAIRRAPSEDLYITLGTFDFSKNAGNFKLVVNPLVNWIWLGFVMLALGTGIALMPEAVLAPLAARAGVPTAAARPGEALAALALVIGLSLFFPGRASAESPPPSAASIDMQMKWFENNVRCMCGCGHMLGACGAECASMVPQQKAEIRTQLEAGKSRDEIIAALIVKHGGQHVLGAPLDKGINRLAWAFPYGLGLAGAGVLAFGAWRFSQKKKPAAPPEGPAMPTAQAHRLEDRLDEELARID